ncbi:MAG TPA: preprotein translocase subunit SecG [Clostridiales bacterium]|nr:preprotein translocase subunit SecG [Clostridiales bacterium]
MEQIIGGILIIIAIFLVAVIMMQQSKRRGLSGVLSGSSSDTYFGKNKAKTKEKMFSKFTTVLGILFAILVFTLYVMHTVIQNKDETSSTDDTSIADTSTTDTTSAAISDEISEEDTSAAVSEISTDISEEISETSDAE